MNSSINFKKTLLFLGGFSSLMLFSMSSYVSVINPSAITEVTNKDDIDTSKSEASSDYLKITLDNQFEEIENILKTNAEVAYKHTLKEHEKKKAVLAAQYPGPNPQNPTRPLFDAGASQNILRNNSNNGDIVSNVTYMVAAYGTSKGGSTPNGTTNSSRPGYYKDVDSVFKEALNDPDQIERFFKYHAKIVSAGQRTYNYTTYETYSYTYIDTDGKTQSATGTRAINHSSVYQVYALDATIDPFDSAPFVEECFWNNPIYEKVDPHAISKTAHLARVLPSRYYSYSSKYVLSDGTYSDTGVNPDNPSAKIQWSLAGFNIPVSEQFAKFLNSIFGKNTLCFPRKVFSRNYCPDHIWISSELQNDYDDIFPTSSIVSSNSAKKQNTGTSQNKQFVSIQQNPAQSEYPDADLKYPMVPALNSDSSLSIKVYTVAERIDSFTNSMVSSVDAAKKCGSFSDPGSLSPGEGESCDEIVDVARKEIGNSGAKYWNVVGGYPNEWCAIFVTYCMMQIKANDNKVWPKNAMNCDDIRNFYSRKGLYHSKSSGYKPKAGDIVLYNWSGNENGEMNHVGIVSADFDGHGLSTIEGNTGGSNLYSTKVKENKNNTYRWQYAAGFCTPQYPASSTSGGKGAFFLSGRGQSFYSMSNYDIKVVAGMVYGEDSSGYNGQFWAASAVLNRAEVYYRNHNGMGPLKDGWSQVYNTLGASGCAARASKSAIKATVDAVSGKRANRYTDFACDIPGSPLASNWIRNNPCKKCQWYPKKGDNLYCDWHNKISYHSSMS